MELSDVPAQARFRLREPPPPLLLVVTAVVVLLVSVAAAVMLRAAAQAVPPLLLVPVAVFGWPVAVALVRRLRRRTPGALVVDDAGISVPALGGAPPADIPLDAVTLAFNGKIGLVVAGAGVARVIPKRSFVDGGADAAAAAVHARLGPRLSGVLARNARAAEVNDKRPAAVYAVGGVMVAVLILERIAAVRAGGNAIIDLGAANRDLVIHGGFWRLFTAPFLHMGELHLLLNGAALLSVGPVFERWLGRAGFLVILLGSALFGAVLSVSAHDVATVGLSGGIFGLVGALGVSTLRYRTQPLAGPRLPVRSWIGLIGVNVVISLLPGVDGVAHLGGALAGAGLCALLAPRLRAGAAGGPVRAPALVRGKAVSLTAALLVAAFAASLVFMTARWITGA